jgi:ureidoglycolate lyase
MSEIHAEPIITAQPLSAAAFASFGQVVSMPDAGGRMINGGTARRIDDAASLDLTAQSGRPQLSLFRVAPTALPVSISMLERHPLSTQTFVPLAERRFLVVVAPAGSPPVLASIQAFVTDGYQGVGYSRGVWHAPVIAFGAETDFVVIGRAGNDENCDIVRLTPAIQVRLNTPWSD